MALRPCKLISLAKALRGQISSQIKFTGSEKYYSLDSSSGTKRYDLVVVGGGSGGLACAKEAADLGKRVAVLDFVDPSPRGSKWGLGGTCVNVGCIPKKLMHQASLLGGAIRDAKYFGWDVPEKPTISWEKVVDGVNNHVKSLNWGHRVKLREKKVDYINAKGYMKDRNTVLAYTSADKLKVHSELHAENIVIATGMRPKYPLESQVPGALQYAISSDDIFWMKQSPGKTLCIGASYVALECAGFLTGFGFDTTVMVRSRPLRLFDQQMAGLVVKYMEQHGTKFLTECLPEKIERDSASGRLKVTWKHINGSGGSELFDTVLYAIGREASTVDIGLHELGVQMDESGFIIGNHFNDQECSSVRNIYAIGDVLKDRPELTPVAIKAGKLLAHRLFANSQEQMDYERVPTTVFTPLEYAFVGMSEEAAVNKFGPDGIEVYHAFFKPLEYSVPQIHSDCCYIKVITDHSSDSRVLGIHYTGPNAGEIMQGYAVALRCGLTKSKLLSTVGIHPTCSEELVKLNITKRSGLDPTVTGC